MQLSSHFSIEEATFSETAARLHLDNVPDASVLHNMTLTADRMEKVREICGNVPLIPSSWYRSPLVNKAVGSQPTSDHVNGLAVDFRVVGQTLQETIDIIHKSTLPFDQLINEYGRWVHIGFGARMRRMVFNIS